MEEFRCPVCREPLHQVQRELRCQSGHSFDLAREGYVNLLQSQKSAEHRHGDDKAMVRARRDFLEKGYYMPLLEALIDSLSANTPTGRIHLLDAGCGEGWYTERVDKALTQDGREMSVWGIDISKDALKYAGKRNFGAHLAVASVFDLPLADNSIDALMQVFAPLAPEEFLRVMRPGGIFVRAVPLENHLWELKQAVYEKPYENKPAEQDIPGFSLLEQQEVKVELTLTDAQDIRNLFYMTPYYYKTSREDQQKLEALTKISTRLEFGVLTYQKNKI